jgi:hypothetical protein
VILYVNGDSHTAAAEAVNQHAFAEDDPDLAYLGRLPHPANLAVSWGRMLADTVKATFKCDAESASSNTRILRTTRAWLDQHAADRLQLLLVIQWSTWEREEWLIQDQYYQITGSGIDAVPLDYHDRYRYYVANLDWGQKTQQAHADIWQLHQELAGEGIRHVFFNGNSHFGDIPESARFDWGPNYISPYDANATYDQWLRRHGHDTVAPNSWHFGRSAHAAWSRFVLQYCIKNQLVP